MDRRELSMDPSPTTSGYRRYDVSSPGGSTDTFCIPERYILKNYVGHGAVGTVCTAIDSATGQLVAIKKLHNVFADLVHSKRIVSELFMLHRFRNTPQVIHTHCVLPPEDPSDFDAVYLVMDYYESDLHDVIKDVEVVLTEDHIRYLSFQILLGLARLHSANCRHRDLKPQNVLVTKDADAVIADFGLAKGYEVEDVAQSLYVVTRWYRPPELLLREPHYDEAVDMWSFGCVLAEMFLHAPLFAGTNQIDQLHKIMYLTGVPTPDVYSDLGSDAARRYLDQLQSHKFTGQSLKERISMASDSALDLLKHLLQFHPKNRISAREALRHSWYASVGFEVSEEELDSSASSGAAEREVCPKPTTPEEARQMILSIINRSWD
eukprot:PhM_4_TR7649/c0_g1_i1/m.66835